MLGKIHNRNINYPFLSPCELSGVIKECRICVLAPSDITDVAVVVTGIDGSEQKVTLHLVGDANYQEPFGTVTYTVNQGFSDSKYIVKQNSFMLVSGFSNQLSGLKCQIHPQCIHIIPQGVQLTLKGQSRVRATAMQQYGSNSWVTVDDVSEVKLLSGYNCKLSFAQNTLSVSSFAGQGKGKHSGYSHWVDFSASPFAGMSDSEIDRYLAGAQSINGQTGNINISVGESFNVTTTSSGVDQKTLELNLSVKGKVTNATS